MALKLDQLVKIYEASSRLTLHTETSGQSTVLESMQYIHKTKRVILLVINWIKTITGLQILCKRLLKLSDTLENL